MSSDCILQASSLRTFLAIQQVTSPAYDGRGATPISKSAVRLGWGTRAHPSSNQPTQALLQPPQSRSDCLISTSSVVTFFALLFHFIASQLYIDDAITTRRPLPPQPFAWDCGASSTTNTRRTVRSASQRIASHTRYRRSVPQPRAQETEAHAIALASAQPPRDERAITYGCAGSGSRERSTRCAGAGTGSCEED